MSFRKSCGVTHNGTASTHTTVLESSVTLSVSETIKSGNPTLNQSLGPNISHTDLSGQRMFQAGDCDIGAQCLFPEWLALAKLQMEMNHQQ
jgi:hypothetical protein